jgi:hypothetical protein
VVDARYEGGTKGNSADDVLGKLISGAGNQGGFRAVGSWDAPRLVILYSSMDDPDWPDFIDVYTDVFTYFGDNKKLGFDLHDTPRRGNKLLKGCFTILHNAPGQRVKIPPFFVFTKGSKGRDVVFRGLAVPGVESDPADDLVATWRSKKGERSRITGPSSPFSIPARFPESGSTPSGRANPCRPRHRRPGENGSRLEPMSRLRQSQRFSTGPERNNYLRRGAMRHWYGPSTIISRTILMDSSIVRRG